MSPSAVLVDRRSLSPDGRRQQPSQSTSLAKAANSKYSPDRREMRRKNRTEQLYHIPPSLRIRKTNRPFSALPVRTLPKPAVFYSPSPGQLLHCNKRLAARTTTSTKFAACSDDLSSSWPSNCQLSHAHSHSPTHSFTDTHGGTEERTNTHSHSHSHSHPHTHPHTHISPLPEYSIYSPDISQKNPHPRELCFFLHAS